MKGWRYEDVDELPAEVYDVLIAMLQREAQERENQP
jgi:hypothetical protein